MSDGTRKTITFAPHILANAERRCGELGISLSAGIALALAQWSGARVAEASLAPEVRRGPGRPPRLPPPLPSREALLEALHVAGAVPASVDTWEWEDTVPAGELSGHLEAGHPEVECWGVNELAALRRTVSDEVSRGWITVEGVTWSLPELVWSLVHGTLPAGKLQKTKICWAGCHICWRPSHYTVGTTKSRFWKD